MEMFAMNVEDRLTFWKNWFDGIDQLPDEMRLAWYDAIMRFAFKGEEPAAANGDLVSAVKFQAVQFVRATIGISRTRKENGAKGARKREANAKQTRSKREANAKQMRSKRHANAKQTRSKRHARTRTRTRARARAICYKLYCYSADAESIRCSGKGCRDR